MIQNFNFRFYAGLDNPKARYPDLVNNNYAIQVFTDNNSYNCIITYNFVTFGIDLSIYDTNQNLIQNKIAVASGINLFYVEKGYTLKWISDLNKFIFGKKDEIL